MHGPTTTAIGVRYTFACYGYLYGGEHVMRVKNAPGMMLVVS
jgi:hypothetical protein